MVEAFLVGFLNGYPVWLLAALLIVAAASFMARWWAQARHGRIREYVAAPLGVAAALTGLALFYFVFAAGALGDPAFRGAARLLLSVMSLALTAFNWGGVRVAWRDIRTAVRGRADE